MGVAAGRASIEVGQVVGSIVEDTVYRRVREIAEDCATYCAVDCGTCSISYGELMERADRCAAAMAASGVGAGDRVAILAPPRPEVFAVLLACSKVGAIFTGLGPRLFGDELERVMRDAEPTLSFAVAHLDGRAYAEEVAACGIGQVIGLSIEDEAGLAPEFEQFLSSGTRVEIDIAQDPKAPLALIFTSGSTGKPKGVPISNLAILTSVTNALARIDMGEVRALSLLPIDHVAFLANECMMVLLSGGTAVQVPKFDVRTVLETIATKKITLWCAIPTMLQRLALSGEMDNFDLSSLDYVWWPGPLSQEAFEAIRTKTKQMGVSYGMTEAAGGITFSDRNTPPEKLLETVGRPLDSIDLRLDQPVELDGRMVGEILIRGPQIISGYRDAPASAADAFLPGGWFRTGDLGALEEGYLSIVGRKKELIRSGGYNISPFEIEAVLETHPTVNFAVVVGVVDPEYGETVAAAVSLHEGRSCSADDLKAHARKKLSGYKIPKYFSLRHSLPFLANGKIDRAGLKRELEAEWQAGSH